MRFTKTTKKITKFLLAGVVGLTTLLVPIQQINNAGTANHAFVSPIAHAQEFYNDKGEIVTETGLVIGYYDPSTGQPISQSKKEFADTLEVILKIIYLLLWPFLALAGLALDNGMVYGSYFQLDSALFTFWNIVKNFANFTLGFLFLWSILKYIFNFGSKAENPMGMITKLLLAGIGIQASWFLIGALIDLSTVATVGIGALPLQMLKQEDVGSKPLFGIKTNLKISDIGNSLTTDKGFVILYTYPTKEDEYYLPCAYKSGKLLWGNDRAATYGITDTQKKIGNTEVTWSQINQNYCIFGNDIISRELTENKQIDPGSDTLKFMLTGSQAKFLDDNKCKDAFNLCQTIATITQKGKGYQGAFYSLYGSLLNLGSIHVSVHKSEGSMTMEAVIKAIIGIAYLVPLLILCVVLIIRIAVLWVTIAFSPILVLAEVFGWKMKDYDKFGIKNAISMIFLPVMATFAISISIVFLSVLSEGLTKGNSLEQIGMNTYHEGDKTCLNLIITTLCIDTPSQDIGVSGMLDFFPWLILNIFGIGLMWTILMAAMKNTAFTGKIVDGVSGFAKNFVTSADIIPLGSKNVSLAALNNTAKNVRGQIDAAAASNANTVVSPALENWMQRNVTGQKGRGQQQITAAVDAIKDNSSARTQITNLVENRKGALYNAGEGAGISNRGNNLDLAQYGAVSLDLVNKLAEIGKLNKKFESVDDAFKDQDFLKYLSAPDKLGLSAQTIKNLYTGREGTLNDEQQAIVDNIMSLGTTTPTGSLSVDHKTYTDADGSTYILTKDGFTKKSKDGKTTTNLTKEDEWNNIVISKEDLENMKKANATITLAPAFNTWMTNKIKPTTNTNGTNPNANANNNTNTPQGAGTPPAPQTGNTNANTSNPQTGANTNTTNPANPTTGVNTNATTNTNPVGGATTPPVNPQNPSGNNPTTP